MLVDDDYVLSIVAALIIYGLACMAIGCWLRASIGRALRGIFRPHSGANR